MNDDHSCPYAPLGMSCEFENGATLACKSMALSIELRELFRSVPIIGNYIKPLYCDMYAPEKNE